MACCKINKGLCASDTGCDTVAVGGAKDLRIAVLCSVSSTVETSCADDNSREITSIVMDNDPAMGGDVEHVFYQFNTSDDTLSFVFDHTFDADNNSIVYNETVSGRLGIRSSAAKCALDELFNKEIVILIKENGDSGQWIVAGLGGGLYLTQNQGGTGVEKTDTTEATITITGALDKRHLYVNWGAANDLAATDAAIDAITELC